MFQRLELRYSLVPTLPCNSEIENGMIPSPVASLFRWHRFAGALLLLLSLPLGAAEQRYYDVELIVFEHLSTQGRESEQWPQQLEREAPERLIEIGGSCEGLLPEYEPDLCFTPLLPPDWRLQEEARKIDESASRRVLLHTAWVQPGLAREQAISVHINRPVAALSVGEESPQPEPAASTGESGSLDALITVSLARYLRVETDLLFRLDPLPATEENALPADAGENAGEDAGNDSGEDATEAETAAAPRFFHVRQLRRRIRSRELHYLDHPVLGVLIMFTPHEITEKAATRQ